jgi:hypothetical protein
MTSDIIENEEHYKNCIFKLEFCKYTKLHFYIVESVKLYVVTLL